MCPFMDGTGRKKFDIFGDSLWSNIAPPLIFCPVWKLPPPIWKFLAPPYRESMGQSGLLMFCCFFFWYPDFEVNKSERQKGSKLHKSPYC